MLLFLCLCLQIIRYLCEILLAHFVSMNTILEIRNSRPTRGNKEASLPPTRKVNPIPPIHYTWNNRIETLKMNTILEIRNHRPMVMQKAKKTLQTLKGTHVFLKALFSVSCFLDREHLKCLWLNKNTIIMEIRWYLWKFTYYHIFQVRLFCQFGLYSLILQRPKLQ